MVSFAPRRRLVRILSSGLTQVEDASNRSPVPAPTRVQAPSPKDIQDARELLSGVPCTPAIVGSSSWNWRGSR